MGHFGDYGLLRFRTRTMVMREIRLLNSDKPPNAHRNCYPLFFFFLHSKTFKTTIMDKINSLSTMEFQVTLKLNEKEARALEAIAGYGSKEFLNCFYEHLGKHYLQPNETGVISLFSTIKEELPKHLSKFDKCREKWIAESSLK